MAGGLQLAQLHERRGCRAVLVVQEVACTIAPQAQDPGTGHGLNHSPTRAADAMRTGLNGREQAPRGFPEVPAFDVFCHRSKVFGYRTQAPAGLAFAPSSTQSFQGR
jgi:hypothetical protein